MIVLGVHLFDLMRFFAGEPLWSSARILQNGHEISLRDSHAATENIGPVAGDDIRAEFSFSNGVYANFISRAQYRNAAGPWGMELVGSKGAVRILMEMIPKIYTRKTENFNSAGHTTEWQLWEEDPTQNYGESDRGIFAANVRVVDDWLDAIVQHREPICSGHAGMKALEMAMAVFTAGLNRERALLPLKNRNHPLKV